MSEASEIFFFLGGRGVNDVTRAVAYTCYTAEFGVKIFGNMIFYLSVIQFDALSQSENNLFKKIKIKKS